MRQFQTSEPTHQVVLLVDDDAAVTEALAGGLERKDRTLITCNDLESAELVVERLQPSHIVSDVRLSMPFGVEGLDFIRFAKRHSPHSRVIMMSGAPDDTRFEASMRGAVAFLQKPFGVAELDSVLDQAPWPAAMEPAFADAVVRVPLLEEVLRSDALKPVFQPIVSLQQDCPGLFGYESLARYGTGSLLRDPEVLFQYASRKQRVIDLELACIAKSIRDGAVFTDRALLFLNLHPETFSNGDRLQEVLQRESRKAGVPLEKVVLEITEQSPLSEDLALGTIHRLRQLGVRFAFDDVGMAYSHLVLIDQIQPAYLKISRLFGTGFEASVTKSKIVRNLLELARDFGCEVILEGIEQKATADAAAALGIPYGQGFLFGRPANAPAFTEQ